MVVDRTFTRAFCVLAIAFGAGCASDDPATNGARPTTVAPGNTGVPMMVAPTTPPVGSAAGNAAPTPMAGAGSVTPHSAPAPTEVVA